MKFMLSVIGLLPMVVLSIDPTSIVNSLLSSLTGSMGNAANGAAGAASGVDAEQLAQQVAEMKEAEADRDRQAAEAAAKQLAEAAAAGQAQNSTNSSNNLDILVDKVSRFGSSIADLTVKAKRLAEIADKLEGSTPTSSTTPTPAQESFVIRVRMPGLKNETAAAEAATSRAEDDDAAEEDISGMSLAEVEENHPELVLVPVKIYDPINPIGDSDLAALPRRISSDRVDGPDSRVSRKTAEDYSRSLKEQILRAERLAAMMEEREELFRNLVEATRKRLEEDGKGALAQSIEASAKKTIELMNETLNPEGTKSILTSSNATSSKTSSSSR